MNCRSLFIQLLVILTVTSGVIASGVLPPGDFEYQFVYDRAERTAVERSEPLTFHLGPYALEDIDLSWSPFADLKSLDQRQVYLFGFFGEDFRAARAEVGRGWESFRGGLVAAPARKLFVYADFSLDEQLARDPAYRGKKWRGLAGDVRQAFLFSRSGPLAVTAGRFASFWGPRNSLVLSAQTPLDGFGYAFHWGRLTLSYRLARLDGLNPDRDGSEQFENRYLAGHRLDINAATWLQLGFFETVVFGGPGRQIDLFYLNPILFYHGTQLNEGIDDNTFLGLDFSLQPRQRIRLYGQLLIDDFQIDRQTQVDEEPNEIAFLTGLHWVNVVPNLDFQLEHSRVTNWTFNQVQERNRYTYNDRLIGGALGNDYDLTEATITHWFARATAASLHWRYHRQGEGQVTSEWTAPWLSASGDYEESFPTGTVEKRMIAAVGLKGFLQGHFFFDINGGVEWIRNFGHSAGINKTVPFVELRISSFLFIPVGVQ